MQKRCRYPLIEKFKGCATFSNKGVFNTLKGFDSLKSLNFESRYMRWIWVLLLLLSIGAMSGCANVSRFEKGALVAHGEQLDGATEMLYYTISINTDRGVDAQIMNVSLKLTPDSTPIPLSELNPETVSRYLPRFIPPQQWPELWKKKEAEYETYAGSGFHIKFDHGRLIYIGICSHCFGGREYPIVGVPDGHAFYSLPLTVQQLIEVFGVPSRVYKVNEVR